MSDEQSKAVFIPASEFKEVEEEDAVHVYDDPEPYSEAASRCRSLSELAHSGNGVSRISVPRDVKRKRVVSAFHDAFEMIGGVPRLAHWADDHPTDFYKLYARILPGEVGQHVSHDGEIRVLHSVPRGPLDE